MISFLKDWQEIIGNLIGGVLTVIAGALIFLEGSRQRRFSKSQESKKKIVADRYNVDFLLRLVDHCNSTIDNISDDLELIRDYVESIDAGEYPPLPESFVRKKFFEISTMHMVAKPINYNVTRMLSDVVDHLELYEADFAQFRNRFGARVISMASGEWQPSFPLKVSDPRREEAVNLMEVSGESLTAHLAVLKEAAIETVDTIKLQMGRIEK